MLAGRVVFLMSLAVAAMASSVVDAAQTAPFFAAWTASPLSVDESALDPVERAALSRCGQGEAGLQQVARTLLARKLEGSALPELDGLSREQRAAGEPHPWPRAFAVRGHGLEAPQVMAKLDAWLGQAAVRLRRCGVASATSGDGNRSLVVVEAEGLADLAPMPTRARTGQWLTLEAHLRVPATSATVVVMDAGGAPRTVPSWMEGNRVRARFAAGRPGELDVQVVADVAGGPRPVLEASVFVDTEPGDSRTGTDLPAPGEAEGTTKDSAATDDARLTRMVTAARASVGLPALPRDPRLDGIARDHARHMSIKHELAHDAGDGDPLERMRATGLDPRVAGENVAHTATLPMGHRAIWDSPSHRLNLLSRSFERMGVGVVRDEGGSFWIVETFAAGL